MPPDPKQIDKLKSAAEKLSDKGDADTETHEELRKLQQYLASLTGTLQTQQAKVRLCGVFVNM